jgi:hypothetical protein
MLLHGQEDYIGLADVTKYEGVAPPPSSAQTLAERVDEVRGVVVASYEDFAKLVERRPTTYLFALGTAVTAVAIVMKFIQTSDEVSVLRSGEFVAMLILGFLLLILGAALLLLQYRNFAEVQERVVRAAIVEGTAEPEPGDGAS